MLDIPPKAATKPPIRAVRLGPTDMAVERRADGAVMLRSPYALGGYPDKLTERLAFWAAAVPDRVLFAKRAPDKRDPAEPAGGWRTVTYAQALDAARRIGAALLTRGLSAERPVMILSGNDIEHALLGLGANYVGIPYAPVSPAYSLVSTDYGKLRHVAGLLTPGLVFAADGAAFAKAIAAAVPPDVEIVATTNPSGERRTTLFAELMATAPSPAVDAAHAAVSPDAIAKFLFTSGSTGTPKAVINTHRMWCANQEMLLTAMAYFADEPPVIVDWAPWHHTAAGNHDVGLVIYNGGTYYIDDGKPIPGAIEETVRNLRDVATNWYFNVPKGFEALLPFLRSDARLRETFFSRLKVLWFAGAGIGQHVFDEMKDLAVATCGEQILFLTGLGSTETAPFALSRTWDTDNATNVGLPPPGLDVKLIPMDGSKYEMRLRGPSITPGYWRDAALTAAAFDDEGFYRLGDAFRFHDPADPGKGLLFEGRIAEDFKLATGTWVHVGPLRVAFTSHFSPLVRDVVIAGPERDTLAALVIPDIDACRRLAPHLDAATSPEALLADPQVRHEFQLLLGTFAKGSTGSSNRIARMVLLAVPPSLDAGEITDKGSINQRAVLRHRAAMVDELYATPTPPWAIVVEP